MKRRRSRVATKSRLIGLNVKLARPHEGLPPALKRLKGVVKVTQTFPDEKDEELSTLYVLQVEAPKAKTILRALRSDPTVAFAEASAPRKALARTTRRSGRS